MRAHTLPHRQCIVHTNAARQLMPRLNHRSRISCRSLPATEASVADVLQICKLDSEAEKRVCQACLGIPVQQLQSNVQELMQTYLLKDVQKLLSSTPQALCLPLADWKGFFEGYGLGKDAFWKALRYSAGKLAGGDVYTAGAAIVWLKQLGPWSDADIANRLIPCYSEVLVTPTSTLQALADRLAGLGMTPDQVQAMLWEFPGMLAEFREQQLPLVVRMVESRRDKYTQGGTYID